LILFPLIAALISFICAGVIAWDGWRRPKPDKIAWALAFAVFAVGAAAEVTGAAAGWSSTLVRIYYLTGPVLVVGYLALGELYLLAPRRVAAIGPGVALLVTAFAVTLVLGAPVDETRLAEDGWEALERGTALKVLAISINAGGTLILAGGALWTAWRFWRRRIFRHRMVGCLLIALGTLIVATGGTLTRLGAREYLYIAMAIGVAVIFAGYLEARRPEAAPAVAAPTAPSTGAVEIERPPGESRVALLPLPTTRPQTLHGDPAIAFIEQLVARDTAALRETLRIWSVDPVVTDRFTRPDAVRAWALRLRLSAAGQQAFDAHAVTEQLQLSELYHEVLAPGVADLDAEQQARGRAG